MTTVLNQPAGLLGLAGHYLHQWIHTDSERATSGAFKGTIARGELTAALSYGLDKVRFPASLRVESQIRATVSVLRARQKTCVVETVFTLTYEIDGEPRPACVADAIALYP